jgi:saccharopine dehydrogenase-like NADP-dependent oxidoreductase
VEDFQHLNLGQIKIFLFWVFNFLDFFNFSDNPFAYKFSWSPKGVLLAGKNGAIYKKENRVIEYNPGTIFKNKEKVSFFPGFNLEGYLNRDSISYIEKYGLKNPKTFFRGTLRYSGFCDVLDAITSVKIFIF